MSFLVKTPKIPQSNAQDGSPVSTYREAEAVPNGFGRDRFVSHWVCKPYDRKTRAMGANQPSMEIASIAGGYREGPIDFVGKVWRDGKLIDNLDFTFSEHGDPESQQFAIPNLGPAAKAIVHRGTVDAPLSIVANLNAKTGQNHPPMRRHAWIEWVDLDLGQGTTALPDLQVEMGKKTPAVGAFAASGFGQWGVNPFAAIYAQLTSETGFGIDPAYFDAADWAAQCTALETTGVSDRTGIDTFCNPVFKAAQTADALLSAVLANVDGFLYVDGGKFRIGWFPSQAPAGGLTEITEADLEAVPQGNAPDWNRGPSSATVIFRDFDRNYGDVPALCPAPANSESSISSTPARADRPQIHVATQAAMIAAEISAAKASAESTTTLTVKKSRAVTPGGAPLMPGDLCAWDYAPHSLDLIVRVVSRRMRSGHTSDLLEVIPERGQFPLPYVAPIDARVLPTSAAPGIINVADVRLWLLPKGFGALRQLAPLVNRAHRGIYRVDLHLSPTGAAPWEDILDSRFFAAKVAVTNGGVNGVATVIRITSTSADFARMAAQSTVNQTDDTLLLLVDNEVMSVGTITVVAANTYDVGILRARKGTTAAVHADGAVGFMFYRDEMMSAQHAEFYRVRDGTNTYDATTATKRFKLQLFTIDEVGLAKPDDPGISLVLPDLSADETAGYTVVLTAEAKTVATANDGTVNAGQLGAGGITRTDVKVYRGAFALAPVNAGPNSDQFSASITAATSATGTKEDADTFRADTLTADTGQIEITVNVAGAFNVVKLFTLSKSKAGAAGAPGAPGAAGATGPVGPGLVYVGAYVAGTIYFKTAERTDVVSVGTNYYPAANAAKSGLTTWGTPGSSGDWGAPFTNFKAVATDLLLANDVTILKTLVMGDGSTGNGGIIRSVGATAYGTGAGFWMNPRNVSNVTEFRVGDPAGGQLAYNGTDMMVGGFTVLSDALRYGSGANRSLLQASGTPYLMFGQFGVTRSATYDRTGFAAANTDLSTSILLSNTSGTALFRLHNSTGTLKCEADGATGNFDSQGAYKVSGSQVVGSRKAAVANAPVNAPNNANVFMSPSDWAGASTISLTALTDHLNAVDAFINTLGDKINEVGARVNDVRDRMKVTGGHGLIAD